MSHSAVTDAQRSEMSAVLKGLAEHWGLVLAYGLTTLALGIVLVVWPDASLAVFAVIVAIQLIIAGIVRIVQALSGDGVRILLGLAGGLALIVGLLVLRDPLQSVLVLTMILGAFWVISGVIRCRQPILRLAEAVDDQGLKCCDIIMAPDMVRTIPRPKAPFQGWRYLDPKDAPADMNQAGGFDEGGSPELAEELARLGLI